jgi:transcriptional regulator GlxA family with amidase domain
MAELTEITHILPRYNSSMGNRPRVIAFVVAPPFELLDLTGPAAVFAYTSSKGKPSYSLRILSSQKGSSVESIGGLKIGDSCHYQDFTGPIDTLIVIGGEGAIDHQSPDFFLWLRKRSANVRRVASVCTGAFILAASGLLAGKRVTTHWRYLDRLAERHKDLHIERDPIFIKDGKYYTTAGVSAGIDLALALVEEDLGHAAAAAVAREMVLFLRRPGSQAQYSSVLAQQETLTDARLRDLPSWVNARLNQQLDVPTLAKVVAMTPRTFARQFELHFRTTPARWVQSLRVEAAKRQLESENTPLRAIASMTGFRDEQSLRRAFMQQLSVTPKDYRERFGAKEALAQRNWLGVESGPVSRTQ